MRRTVLLLAGVLLAAVALGSDSPKEYDDSVKMDELQGAWEVVSRELRGQTILHSEDGLIFHKGEFKWTGPGDNPKGFYKIDTTHTIAWLDYTETNEPRGKKHTTKSIYRIDGNTLKIAYYLLNNDYRPQNFDTQADGSLRVLTLKRIRK